MSTYFILSCARSGSTSLARILDSATNGVCAIEPTPNLNVESRLAMEGRLADPDAIVREQVEPRIRAALETHAVYGEKNVTYGPFVPQLRSRLDAKFVFLKRDGRDVVRSLLDWHEQMFGNVYREAPDPVVLAPRAMAAVAASPVHLDSSDFLRPRPMPGSSCYDRWESMSRFEMCAYYWATVNDLHRSQREAIPAEASIEIDYTNSSAEDVLRVAAFCGLEGLDVEKVASMLDARINSIAERAAKGDAGNDDGRRQPNWRSWNGGRRRAFDAIAGPTMERLGYANDPATRWRPAGYGACWHDHAADVKWYEWMHGTRRPMHDEAVAWIRGFDGTDEAIESVADFGCGVGVGYCDALADRRYIGFDLVESSIEWCRENRTNPLHFYERLDFIAEPTSERSALVMSSGTIDNAYDVEAYLDAMMLAAERWIYLTCYRGWFPDLEEHAYEWSETDQCFYTNISPRRVREHLERRSCRAIVVEPRPTGRDDIPLETRIIARMPARR